MKLLASLLITVSLICGALAASTAYLAPLSLPDDALIGLTLGAPAGAQPVEVKRDAATSSTPKTGEELLAEREAVRPILNAGAEITAESLAALRDGGVKQVKVKSFSFARWKYGWVFGLSVLGLLVGAAMLRREAKAAGLADAGAAGKSKIPDAIESLRAAREGISQLRSEIATVEGADHSRKRLAMIVKHVTAIQEGPLTDFIASRPRLIATKGLSGYAAVMDKFAGAERQVNRAWSAAADGYLEESEVCLATSEPLLVEAIERLNA